jgi:carboxymethylenebutenolidase
MAALPGLSEADLVADLRSGLAELGRRAPGLPLGTVGFCFGGGMVWQLLGSGPSALAAAMPSRRPPSTPNLATWTHMAAADPTATAICVHVAVA